MTDVADAHLATAHGDTLGIPSLTVIAPIDSIATTLTPALSRHADVVKLTLDAQGLLTDAPFISPCRGPHNGGLIEAWWT